MTSNELIEYWRNGSDIDYKAMKNLFDSKDYTWSLFIAHLVIEKLAKGLFAKNNSENPHAPKTHNILTILKNSNVDLDDDRIDKLSTINTFNISARYDDYKKEFYNKCTKEYTEQQIKNVEEVRLWLREQLM